MARWVSLVAIAAAACGRVGFDDQGFDVRVVGEGLDMFANRSLEDKKVRGRIAARGTFDNDFVRGETKVTNAAFDETRAVPRLVALDVAVHVDADADDQCGPFDVAWFFEVEPIIDDEVVLVATLDAGTAIPRRGCLGYPLRADFDGDGCIGCSDADYLDTKFGTDDALADLSSNGIVDLSDLAALAGELGLGCAQPQSCND